MIGIPSHEVDIADTYREFGDEVAGHSPAYHRLCLEIAATPALLALIGELPVPKRQPNILLAAARLHDVPLEAVAIVAAWERLTPTILTRRTQTNEPGRVATLLPFLAALPQPLALIEVGASAGLCLYPDRYAYDYNGVRLGDSPVVLACDGPAPQAIPQVVWRAGLDLNPLDVSDVDDARWLECLIWPEQQFRRDRLVKAIELARQDPPHLVRGDLLTDLPSLAAQAPAGATLVVFHTAVLAYVDGAGRERFREQVMRLPGHWISNEAGGVMHHVDGAREGMKMVIAVDDTPVATAAPHGQWVKMLG